MGTHFSDLLSFQEKYGPKELNKPSSNAQGKPDKPKPNADVDINVGLSTRPPWFCRYANMILSIYTIVFAGSVVKPCSIFVSLN